MELINLKISSVTNPVGIEESPYFSYVLKSERRNVRQRYSVITVKDGDKIVWTHREEGEKSTFIPYTGILKSRTRYSVEVLAENNYGERACVNGYFETSLFKEDWRAQWVKSSLPIFEAEKGFAKQPPATLFQKVFTCKQNVKRARLYCTCHGIYLPYLNGARFTNVEFAPEHSTYEKILFFQTYDITEFLKKGKNIFSMYVGDGWYLGVKTTPRVKNYERRHAVLFQMELEYENGETQLICSDDSVQCAYAKVISSDLYAGERYDDNLELNAWQNALTANYGYKNLVSQYDGRVVCVEEIKAQKVFVTPNGETVLDFGKVLAGKVRMKLCEEKGRTVRLTHSEVLDNQGNFFQSAQMPDGGVEQCDEFISSGMPCIYEPLFTYHGFRYVKVEGISDLKIDNFTARIYSTEKENAGKFTCSDERFNTLYRNIRNSQTSNLFSIPTDCPQREKAGWTGDIAIYGKTALLNEDISAFLRRWLLSVRADQGENGAVPIVVPYDGGYPMSELFFGPMFEERGTIGSSGWGDCCIAVPYALYKITGNDLVIRENLDVMEKWCGYILERCKLPCKDKNIPPELDRYLWNGGYHQGDWLVPSLCMQELDMMQTLEIQQFTAQYTAPMYGYFSFARMKELMSAIDEPEKSEYYGGVAENMKHAIQNVLFDENGDLPTDLMGAYVLAVAFDLVPERFKNHVKIKLESKWNEKNVLDTGFLSTPYLLDAYAKIGRLDLAYKLLYQTRCPSWLYEVEKGATAMWESWDNYKEDGNPKAISFNHYAFGCVDEWIVYNVCGIIPTSEGFKTMRIQPQIESGFEFVERSFRSYYGEIYVKWRKKNGIFVLECEIPCNTAAEIVLPSGKKQAVGSGKYLFEEGISA